jgi:hypothetical protein
MASRRTTTESNGSSGKNNNSNGTIGFSGTDETAAIRAAPRPKLSALQLIYFWFRLAIVAVIFVYVIYQLSDSVIIELITRPKKQ